MSPETLTEQELSALGLADPARAKRILLSLAGQGVTDEVVGSLLPSLFEALRESPDPDRALNNFERWTHAVTNRYTHFQYLLGHPMALKIFFNVCGVSQFFSDILIRNPEYFEILANPGVRGGGRTAGAVYRELSRFVDHILRPELKLEAMRRFKQREILRIGTRDILGLADMPTTVREFSHLADACVQKCYEIAVAQLAERHPALEPGQTPIPFAVIGMGKLGGQELNYSSDIDLMFVCGDPSSHPAGEKEKSGGEEALPTHTTHLPPHPSPLEYAHKLAEAIIHALSKNLQNGHLFRVDMRLRPEGRFGALVRTLSSYKAYYESWAEPWERQALLKARPVAGDTTLGEAFMQMIVPYVYRRAVTTEFVEDIRRNKLRIEKKAEQEGQAYTNVKVGYGGIRDIEFIVQLLQLELGGRYPLLRTPSTLEALARLRQVGVLSVQEADELADDYRFLRTVEHRLQILYELQTQTLPTDPAERRLLARRLGFNSAEEFDAEYTHRTRRVREHFENLFLGNARRESRSAEDSWVELLVHVDSPGSRAAILQQLREAGFVAPERAYSYLKTAIVGSEYGLVQPEARKEFRHLAARLMAACRRTGDPDAALRGIETLAAAMPNTAEFYRLLAEGEEVMERLCRLGAGSAELVQALARRLEWLDLLVSEEIIDPAPKPREQSLHELEERGLLATSRARKSESAFWDTLALYIQRERLRIGARDIWGEAPPLTITRELTTLAEVVLEALLEYAQQIIASESTDGVVQEALESVALIGLGKLGGRELGYGSDWDILIVYTEPPGVRSGKGTPSGPSPTLAAVHALAEVLLAAGEKLQTRGAPVKLDARLRPEGRFGPLARTVKEYRDYYLHSALTWERQVLTKARPVAGNMETGRAYLRAVHEALYGAPLSEEAQEEIRAMKRRIEHERLKPNARYTDIKLGHGGMNDIEFTAQLWQMRVGARWPQVRVAETVGALHALGGVGAIPAPEAARLVESYIRWTAIRNRLSLLGVATDTLPADLRRLRALAVGLGAVDEGKLRAEEIFRRQFEERMRETRALVERLFYS